MIQSMVHVLLALISAPLLQGVINRVKAFFGGRRGQPLLQPYFDMIRLLRKGAVYGNTTTWIFRISSLAAAAGPAAILALLPLGRVPAMLSFNGDMILLVYMLAAVRFLMVLGAMDTGSSFEGMGASREVLLAALSEVAFMLCLAALAAAAGSFSLSGVYREMDTFGPVSVMSATVLLILLLSENCRIPVDDPRTHLELTMIHEVMVLDHCGIDLCLIQYGSALKLWVFSALFSGICFPFAGRSLWADLLAGLAGVFATAVVTGVIESTMARIRMKRLPEMLSLASVLALTAFLWEILV